VDEQPYRSSDEGRKVPPAEIGDNAISPNRGQGPLLDVPVWNPVMWAFRATAPRAAYTRGARVVS
jgi:hypothetical protein